jgi:Nucleolar protein 12 (25kDa)
VGLHRQRQTSGISNIVKILEELQISIMLLYLANPTIFSFSPTNSPMKNYKKTKKAKPTKIKPVELISYNEADRKEFITGFHKRKVAHQKARVAKAVNRQKEEKRDSRKLVRAKISAVLPDVARIDEIQLGGVETQREKINGINDGEEIVVTVTEFDAEDLVDLQE